jgi:hypothetical protein
MKTNYEEQEIASFTETGKIITHRNRRFDILHTDHKDSDSPYILRSARGDYFALVRNRPNPTHLFGVSLYGHGLKSLQGWFSDKTGELVSLG